MQKKKTDKADRMGSGPSGSGSKPERTCIGCGQKAGQAQLVRLALANGRVLVDREKRGGRGAWLHPAETCLERAVKRRVIARAFRQPAVVADTAVFMELLTRSGRKH